METSNAVSESTSISCPATNDSGSETDGSNSGVSNSGCSSNGSDSSALKSNAGSASRRSKLVFTGSAMASSPIKASRLNRSISLASCAGSTGALNCSSSDTKKSLALALPPSSMIRSLSETRSVSETVPKSLKSGKSTTLPSLGSCSNMDKSKSLKALSASKLSASNSTISCTGIVSTSNKLSGFGDSTTSLNSTEDFTSSA